MATLGNNVGGPHDSYIRHNRIFTKWGKSWDYLRVFVLCFMRVDRDLDRED